MTMTDGMDEVMAAVDAVHLAGWMRHGLPSTQTQQARKAVEQAVARLVWRELTIQGCSTLGYCDNYAQIEKWRALVGEQEPARSDGGTE